jgi:hypothetical protein
MSVLDHETPHEITPQLPVELSEIPKQGTELTVGNENSQQKNDTPESLETINREKNDANYPKGLRLSLIVLSLCLAVFLMALEYVSRSSFSV